MHGSKNEKENIITGKQKRKNFVHGHPINFFKQ